MSGGAMSKGQSLGQVQQGHVQETDPESCLGKPGQRVGPGALSFPAMSEGLSLGHVRSSHVREKGRCRVNVARVEVDGETRELGPGGLVHVESTTPRRVSNASEDEELVILVVGGADGYVGRDGQMVDPKDIERRRSFSR